jgi:hypothetical protein
MKKENILKGVVIGIVACVIFILGGLMLSSNESVQEVTQDKPEQSKVFKEEYMKGCITEGATYAYCDCTYDFMENKVGYKKLVELSIEFMETNKLPDIMLEAVSVCLSEY